MQLTIYAKFRVKYQMYVYSSGIFGPKFNAKSRLQPAVICLYENMRTYTESGSKSTVFLERWKSYAFKQVMYT